ncbi:uncharacterized protein LOC132513717 isoform X2 [Lagenorhynchus albirostris]|uniref:uncharacterized protein LOC132513717 isoform X2 n=1 Tax=Lagenorhynchus albirostris TaxID=27610 RepID=UPI0028E8336E|nr:uncharacterized protein LOC132513717 isoform X2 [Lagenorhynchus albirostris]
MAAAWREVVKARASQMEPEVSHKRLEVHRPCSCRLLLGREEMVSPGRADAEYGVSVATPSHGLVANPHRTQVDAPRRDQVETPPTDQVDTPRRDQVETPRRDQVDTPRRDQVETPPTDQPSEC